MKNLFCNDKFLITLAVTILGIGAYIYGYLTMISAENIITAIISGLFGMGTGTAMERMRSQLGRATDPPEKKEEVAP